MRSVVAPAAVLIVMALMFTVPLMGGSAEAAEGDTEVTVWNVSGAGDAVTVRISDADNVWESEIDDLNFWKLKNEMPAGEYTLEFSPSGDFWPRLSDAVRWEDGRYILTVGDDPVDVVMVFGHSYGTVSGIVTYDGNPVSGVTVSVFDPDDKVIGSDRTDSKGEYSIDCPLGAEYIIEFSDARFQTERYHVSVYVAGDITLDAFGMTTREVATFLFGLDLTHSLMLIGGIIGLFVLFFVILYRIHISKHPESSKVYSEPRKKDQE
ncbi:MAG: carboxypeptidase-like regulatory domain-containing protein [Methanomassiliicoccaceae archaeon]|jgi:hypothetical protein|nr:carboxypeptidase-like regulatory domain-containing protein [Methanomassiliicoccaceae archaeon]